MDSLPQTFFIIPCMLLYFYWQCSFSFPNIFSYRKCRYINIAEPGKINFIGSAVSTIPVNLSLIPKTGYTWVILYFSVDLKLLGSLYFTV